MGYLISAWKETQKTFNMSLKQVVNIAGDGTLENDESKEELREFFSMIDLETMERLLGECYNKEKKFKFDTRGFAFQDLINEMGRRLGYSVENGLYRGKKNEIGFDGLWKAKDGSYIIMESKTSDDYAIAIESVIGYRDKLLVENKVPKNKCSVLIVYGRDEKNALRNTVKGSDEAKHIRLISANALFQLVKILDEKKDEVHEKQINNILKPKDYFVLDNLVELVFPQTDDDIPDLYEDTDEDLDAKDTEDIKSNIAKSSLPDLPSLELKAGEFVKTAMRNLKESDYIFSEEILKKAYSVEESKKYTKRNLPLFWKLEDHETAKDYDEKDMQRYWKDVYEYGSERFLMYSQWYPDGHGTGSKKEDFIEWYYTLINS